jgi:hypothetical protein
MLEADKPQSAAKFATGKVILCHRESCNSTATCFLENRFLCVTHFISHCYERLEECHANPYGGPDAACNQADVRFLRECCERAANLVPPARGLENLERARLFDIFLWASDLLAKRGVVVERKPWMSDKARG